MEKDEIEFYMALIFGVANYLVLGGFLAYLVFKLLRDENN